MTQLNNLSDYFSKYIDVQVYALFWYMLSIFPFSRFQKNGQWHRSTKILKNKPLLYRKSAVTENWINIRAKSPDSWTWKSGDLTSPDKECAELVSLQMQ